MSTVAYLGPAHTHTHEAARRRFGPAARYVHAPTVEEVFHLVERGRAHHGVVPVENSLEGAVTRTLDRFIDVPGTPVQIHGEIEQMIHHYLIRRRRVPLSGLRVVYSHPQALAQCRQWLHQHLPGIVQRETNSTADAVQYVLQDRTGAAIGRRELADSAGLAAMKIPDTRDNKTRFLILGLGTAPRGRRHKTSLLVALKDKPGALHDALMPFKRQRLNLTKIESRPSKQKAWEYLFFIDVEGHAAEPRLRRALAALARRTARLQVLGSYPSGRTPGR
jgi:chorismate mutase/prephenate dehydratase